MIFTWYRKAAVVFAGMAITASFSVSFWMTGVVETDELNKVLESLQHQVNCINCMEENNRKKTCKSCLLWKTKAPRDLPPSQCLMQRSFRNSLKKMVQKRSREEEQELREEMKGKKLFSTVEAMYQSSRVIVHWFPIGTTMETNNTRVINDYEHYRSTYTISAGPDGSYHDGDLVITSPGMYYVYAKVTFECTDADQKMKHVEIKVTKEHPATEKHSVIMSETVKAKCMLEGDLTTLFQRALVHLHERDMLTLTYKTPENVQLSSTRDRAYKSYLGMYRVSQ